MADLIDRIFGLTPDPKATEFFLMGSSFQMIALLMLYVLFVKKWGPSLMKNRQAFKLRGVLLIFNSLQIAMNAYLFYGSTRFFLTMHVWKGRCYIMNTSRTDVLDRHVFLFHLYCMTKVSDLLDTIFFVLRKRYNQVSFLHFYHHLMMSGTCYMFVRYNISGPFILIGMLNCFVHIVMYSYYLMSSFWPNGKNQLWWKKYITLMQLVQFVLITVYTLYPALHGDDCEYSPMMVPFVVVQNGIMIVLFTNFYIKAYVVKAKPKV